MDAFTERVVHLYEHSFTNAENEVVDILNRFAKTPSEGPMRSVAAQGTADQIDAMKIIDPRAEIIYSVGRQVGVRSTIPYAGHAIIQKYVQLSNKEAK